MGKSKVQKIADIWKRDVDMDKEFYKALNNGYVDTDMVSMYPSKFLEKSKTYEVCIDETKSVYLHNVETIKFSDKTINFYDAEGNILANFKRDEYKYFIKVGLG